MVKLQQTPTSGHSVPVVANPIVAERGPRASEARPYLVPVQQRKPAQTTRRYLDLFPHESEDARLTGETRSLYRRLLALNLPTAASASAAAIAKAAAPAYINPTKIA